MHQVTRGFPKHGHSKPPESHRGLEGGMAKLVADLMVNVKILGLYGGSPPQQLEQTVFEIRRNLDSKARKVLAYSGSRLWQVCSGRLWPVAELAHVIHCGCPIRPIGKPTLLLVRWYISHHFARELREGYKQSTSRCMGGHLFIELIFRT